MKTYETCYVSLIQYRCNLRLSCMYTFLTNNFFTIIENVLLSCNCDTVYYVIRDIIVIRK